MILAGLILIPAVGGLLAWFTERFNPARPKFAALAAMAAE